MNLPHDICRCADTHCPESHTCRRYLERFDTGHRTPITATMRDANGECDSKIEVTTNQQDQP